MVAVKKRLYLCLPNGENWTGAFDSNDPSAHADLQTTNLLSKIHLPDPPVPQPPVDTLEPTITDDASFNQLIPSGGSPPLAKTFLDSPVNIIPHKSLNTSRGVISEPDLLTTPEAEILDGFSDQGVIQVRRITIKKDTAVIPTKHIILTFSSPTIPHTIKAGYLNCKIRPYIPNPLRCFKCQRFGHSQTSCRGQLTCSRCASVGHASTDCSLEPKCFNCSESHQSDSKLCSKWKLEKKIQEIKTSKNISYPRAQKLILPQISQTYSQATKSSTTTTTTQTDDSITKIVCPPLKLLQPLTAVLKPTMPFKIPTVTKLSASTEAQLLPTTSSAAATSSESQPPVPFVITTSSASISLITSTTTMFTALSNKTHPSALETTTSNSIPSTIISPVSHASTQKSRRKKRNPKTICNVTAPTVKPKIEIKMAPHKPRKSSSIQDTDDEDMIVYDMAEQIESPKKNDKYFLSEEYWKNESWRQGDFFTG
ncbi:RNA-directed DNA polymerase from mobile element jockey [Trichonephila clavipes]|nr:RNA-directed DNA polymerase from mobile element jockey [Trichonephila clavipes]